MLGASSVAVAAADVVTTQDERGLEALAAAIAMLLSSLSVLLNTLRLIKN